MSKKTSWLHSNWTIGIVCALLPLICSGAYDLITKKPILSTLWNILVAIFTYEVKFWIVVSGITLFLILRKVFTRVSSRPASTPDFHAYTQGRPKSWLWKWNWSIKNNSWVITNMTAHCPHCGTAFLYHSGFYSTYFECPRCNLRVSDREGGFEDPVKVEAIIVDNANRQKFL